MYQTPPYSRTTSLPPHYQQLQTILNTRPDTKVNIQWVPDHTAVHVNEKADKCAKQAAKLTQRSRLSFTTIAYIKRQIPQAGLQEWQSIFQANQRGCSYCSLAKGMPLWVPTWKLTKLPQTNQAMASTIHQLRLGHGYFRSYLTRLPNDDSPRCQCSEPVQTAKHLLLGCPLYKEERERTGIGRETTLQSLLFTLKGTAALIDFIQETRVATRSWLLQGVSESDEKDT